MLGLGELCEKVDWSLRSHDHVSARLGSLEHAVQHMVRHNERMLDTLNDMAQGLLGQSLQMIARVRARDLAVDDAAPPYPPPTTQ